MEAKLTVEIRKSRLGRHFCISIEKPSTDPIKWMRTFSNEEFKVAITKKSFLDFMFDSAKEAFETYMKYTDPNWQYMRVHFEENILDKLLRM